jgi:hypothetical protein
VRYFSNVKFLPPPPPHCFFGLSLGGRAALPGRGPPPPPPPPPEGVRGSEGSAPPPSPFRNYLVVVKAYLLAGGQLILVFPQVLDALDALAQQLFRLGGSSKIIDYYLRLHGKFYDGARLNHLK